jgi:hypothetical protein
MTLNLLNLSQEQQVRQRAQQRVRALQGLAVLRLVLRFAKVIA